MTGMRRLSRSGSLEIPEAVEEMAAALNASDWENDLVRQRVAEQTRAVRLDGHGLTAHRVVQITAEKLAAVARE